MNINRITSSITHGSSVPTGTPTPSSSSSSASRPTSSIEILGRSVYAAWTQPEVSRALIEVFSKTGGHREIDVTMIRENEGLNQRIILAVLQPFCDFYKSHGSLYEGQGTLSMSFFMAAFVPPGSHSEELVSIIANREFTNYFLAQSSRYLRFSSTLDGPNHNEVGKMFLNYTLCLFRYPLTPIIPTTINNPFTSFNGSRTDLPAGFLDTGKLYPVTCIFHSWVLLALRNDLDEKASRAIDDALQVRGPMPIPGGGALPRTLNAETARKLVGKFQCPQFLQLSAPEDNDLICAGEAGSSDYFLPSWHYLKKITNLFIRGFGDKTNSSVASSSSSHSLVPYSSPHIKTPTSTTSFKHEDDTPDAAIDNSHRQHPISYYPPSASISSSSSSSSSTSLKSVTASSVPVTHGNSNLATPEFSDIPPLESVPYYSTSSLLSSSSLPSSSSLSSSSYSTSSSSSSHRSSVASSSSSSSSNPVFRSTAHTATSTKRKNQSSTPLPIPGLKREKFDKPPNKSDRGNAADADGQDDE